MRAPVQKKRRRRDANEEYNENADSDKDNLGPDAAE